MIRVHGTRSDDRDGHGDGPLYRFALWRTWGSGPRLLWVMLNPSTADHDRDDPTMRRVVQFSERWGHGACVVVNLFALRSPSPRDIRRARDPVGGMDQERAVRAALRWTTGVVAAWGACPYPAIADDMRRRLVRAGRDLWCLGRSQSGAPLHPLARGKSRVPDDQEPLVWSRDPRCQAVVGPRP